MRLYLRLQQQPEQDAPAAPPERRQRKQRLGPRVPAERGVRAHHLAPRAWACQDTSDDYYYQNSCMGMCLLNMCSLRIARSSHARDHTAGSNIPAHGIE